LPGALGQPDPDEQKASVTRAARISDPAAMDYLRQCGIVVEAEHGWPLFSPLWRLYLERTAQLQQEMSPIQIDLDPNSRKVFVNLH
jgi:hypothetical protein